ncbi:MAG: head GIN domain-containing protein [Bacteroidota bacterium]
MKTSNKILLAAMGTMLLLGTSFMLAARLSLVPNGEAIKGNDNTENVQRQVEEFSEIRINGPFQVKIEKGPPKIDIRAESNIIPNIITKVKGMELSVEIAEGTVLFPEQDIQIQINTPELELIRSLASKSILANGPFKSEQMKIIALGSGNIFLNSDSEELTVKNNGTSRIELKGKTQKAKLEINGTGDIEAYDLMAKTARTSINGSADMKLHIIDQLKAEINGMGTIYLKGKPKLQFNRNGVGKVKYVDYEPGEETQWEEEESDQEQKESEANAGETAGEPSEQDEAAGEPDK